MQAKIFIWIFIIISIFACTSKKIITLNPKLVASSDTILVKLPNTSLSSLNSLKDRISYTLDTSNILSSGFTGLEIYDLGSKEILFSRYSDKYFISASNTKLFTLYTCLHAIKDSLTAFRYIETDSTFTFWGCADPTFLHPYFFDPTVLEFLKNKAVNKKMILAYNDTLPHYGAGWMWDDFGENYQPEVTSFPIYGNVLWVYKDSSRLAVQPPYFLNDTSVISGINEINRDYHRNHFYFPRSLSDEVYFEQDIPYRDASEVNPMLLGQLLNKKIEKQKLPLPSNAIKFCSWPIDTVLNRMMEVSDNMLAEHLLLASGMEMLDTLSWSAVIQWSKAILMSDVPHRMIWVDGSGLSRYNRFTPASIVYLLKKMYAEIPESRLFDLMVEGGYGTLTSMYEKENVPFVYAKSGSMTGVYNLSGYLITIKGRKLAFSFMNNNFGVKVPSVKKEIEKILLDIRQNY
jgi:serine-type D-Ala-D-Ala carboxypeptidase/endopeptidase (penicillin-binding protein 4)